MTVPQVLHPFAAPTRQAGDFLEIVRGEGCRLWDSDGHVYLDGTASLWYCAAATAAVRSRTRSPLRWSRWPPTTRSRSFTNGPEQRLAELLMELEPIPDARVLFTLTGSEAVDSALKLTRAGHRAAGDAGRTVFLSRHYAYHGVMLGGTSVGGLPANRRPYGPLLGDCYPGRARLAGGDAGGGRLPRPRAHRGDHHRAGARRRRGVPAAAGLPAGPARAV